MASTETAGQSLRRKKAKRRASSDSDDTTPKVPVATPVAPAPAWWREFLTRAVGITLLLGIAAGGVGGFFIGQQYKARPPRPPEKGPAYVPLAAWSPRQGPEHAKVTIVEFSDFQCPFCSRVVPTIKQIVTDYKDDVSVRFRHKPLPMHKDARSAALAMQAAQRQGKAWEMHDLMFTKPKDLGRSAVEGLAQELGLDVAKFRADLDDPKVAEEVDGDDKAADSVEARGTPCFFINGRRVAGAKPIDEFKRIIDEELKKANELIAGGTPIAEVYDKLAKAQKTN